MISDKEINKILQLLQEAFERHGKKLTSASIVKDIKTNEDGTTELEGEVLFDERDKDKLN
jgi:hypothetical protein